MKLIVYKGFDKAFLSSQTDPPLLSNSIENKVDVLAFDRSYRKQLDMELLYLKDNDKALFHRYAMLLSSYLSLNNSTSITYFTIKPNF